MAYYRKRGNQSFRRRRYRRGVKKPGTVGSMIPYVKYIPGLVKSVGMLKGIINSEKHYTDVSLAGTGGSAGSIQLINQVAQGDDVNNRDGNSILCKYIYGNVYLAMNASATNTVVRCMIVMDTANQGSTPAVTDVIADYISPMNVDNTKRFVTLVDRRYTFSINGDRGRLIKFYVPVNKHLRYSSTTGTSVLQNALYLIIISNEGTNTPTFAGTWRIAFYDN